MFFGFRQISPFSFLGLKFWIFLFYFLPNKAAIHRGKGVCLRLPHSQWVQVIMSFACSPSTMEYGEMRDKIEGKK